jgi:hypothetical protein
VAYTSYRRLDLPFAETVVMRYPTLDLCGSRKLHDAPDLARDRTGIRAQLESTPSRCYDVTYALCKMPFANRIDSC